MDFICGLTLAACGSGLNSRSHGSCGSFTARLLRRTTTSFYCVDLTVSVPDRVLIRYTLAQVLTDAMNTRNAALTHHRVHRFAN